MPTTRLAFAPHSVLSPLRCWAEGSAHASSCLRGGAAIGSLQTVRQAFRHSLASGRSCRADLHSGAACQRQHTLTPSRQWQRLIAVQHGRGVHGVARAAVQASVPAAVQASFSRAARAVLQWRCQGTAPEAASLSSSIGISLSRFVPVSQSQRWTASQYRRIVDEMQVSARSRLVCNLTAEEQSRAAAEMSNTRELHYVARICLRRSIMCTTTSAVTPDAVPVAGAVVGHSPPHSQRAVLIWRPRAAPAAALRDGRPPAGSIRAVPGRARRVRSQVRSVSADVLNTKLLPGLCPAARPRCTGSTRHVAWCSQCVCSHAVTPWFYRYLTAVTAIRRHVPLTITQVGCDP